jgi:hypothetical protein
MICHPFFVSPHQEGIEFSLLASFEFFFVIALSLTVESLLVT